MKSVSLRDTRRTLDNSFEKSNFASLNSTMTIDVKEQISEKFKTFTRWNYRSAIKRKKKESMQAYALEPTDNQNMISAILMFTQQLKQKEDKKNKSKKTLKVEELEGVKQQRRQRFKKTQNPLLLVQHYMSKEGFKPTEEENHLLDRVIKLKDFIDQSQPMNLDIVLQKVYKIMNMAVDLNEMRFLILTIILAAEIAFESKEFVRSFHFYTQAMIAATCARMSAIKIECFVQMGRIAMEHLEYEMAIKFFKKGLQYSWKMKETEAELRFYDWLGQAYYYQGEATHAHYYHTRYIQGELEEQDSAVRRISYEMLTEFDKLLENSETNNLTQLFIEYLTLPITNFNFIPATKVKKPYPNYANQLSPRKNKAHKDFGVDDLAPTQTQMQRALKYLPQFATEIPSPDLQKNFTSTQKFGRIRKEIEFEKSNEYHKIIGVKVKKCSPDVYKLPIDERIERALSDKPDPNWWTHMVTETKKQRQQRLGQLRDRVKKTHMSYHKYPEERRRAQSLKADKINESINKTLLNWIDPPKDKFL